MSQDSLTNANPDSPTAEAYPSPQTLLGDAVVLETNPKTSGKVGTQFVYTVGVAFSVVLLQMFQGILLARLLGPEGRGEYATAILYVQLLMYIGLLGGLDVICRYAALADGAQTKLRRAAFWLGLTTGTFTTLVAFGLCYFALPAEKQFLMPMALLCSIGIIGQHVMLIMMGVDRGSGQFAAYNIRRVIAASALPTLLLITFCVYRVDLTITCVLSVIASLISMSACVIGLPKPFRGESEPKVPTLLKESRPYGVSMLATDLFERLDLLLILWLAPFVQQGYYAAMVPVVYPLTVIPNTMGLFLFNAGARPDTNLTTKDVHRILGSAMSVQLLSTIAFMFVIGWAVQLLYGDPFVPAVQFALWLAPVAAIRGVLQGLDSYIKGRGRPMAIVPARIFGIGVIVFVTWLLYPHHGALAVAMGALAGQTVCLIWLSAIVYADVYRHQSEPPRVIADG
ncbi:MAG: lipopolysaccharide biosynthesis protein [Pirellulaceae bacterium]|nr:lipopolysaccharide biosynthesis protein [Pirellulaceae bacterium]